MCCTRDISDVGPICVTDQFECIIVGMDTHVSSLNGE